jgi:acyl-CoA thioester hydrolase
MSQDEAADPYHDVWETRVRFTETDAQGVVFFGEYLTYLDETVRTVVADHGKTE